MILASLVLFTHAMAAEVETDAVTVAAIAATVYSANAILHEGVGHEFGCLIGGGKPTGFSTAVAGCEVDTASGYRLLTAGGALGNLAFGAGFGVSLAAAPPEDGAAHYALWLATVTNLWQASGYLMVGPWLPVGDWGSEGFLRDVDHPLPLQIGLSALGTGMTLGTIPVAHQLGKPLFGEQRYASGRGRLLTLMPYFGGSSLIVGSALLGRAGPEFAVSAAVSNFAGTLFLAYLPLFFSDKFFEPGDPYKGEIKAIRRSPAWWVVGGVVALGTVAVLGPGVGQFEKPHPLDPR